MVFVSGIKVSETVSGSMKARGVSDTPGRLQQLLISSFICVHVSEQTGLRHHARGDMSRTLALPH